MLMNVLNKSVIFMKSWTFCKELMPSFSQASVLYNYVHCNKLSPT